MNRPARSVCGPVAPGGTECDGAGRATDDIACVVRSVGARRTAGTVQGEMGWFGGSYGARARGGGEWGE